MGGRIGAAAIAAGLALAGCATTPDATVHYNLPAAEATLTVTQSIDCTPSKHPVIGRTVKHDVRFFADPTRMAGFALKGLSRYGANTDVTFELFEDGRLKSIDASSTGRGEDIAKAVTTIAVTAATFLTAPTDTLCAHISEGKPVTLTYSGSTRFADLKPVALALEAGADPERVTMAKLAARITVDFDAPKPVGPRVTYAAGRADDYLPLTISKARSIHYRVWKEASLDEPGRLKLDEGDLVVPDPAGTDVIQVPRAALFGKQGLKLALGDSGLLPTKIGYSRESGAAGALGVVGGALTAAQPETTAQKAADLKAEADLIAQQERVVRCKANSTNCT